MQTTTRTAQGSMPKFSVKLFLSYVLDWIAIIGLAAISVIFSRISPRQRAFSLADPTIAYPNRPDTISSGVLFVLALIGPGVLVFLFSAVISVGGTYSTPRPSRAIQLRRKLWELNAGWMGLALALAVSQLITNGAKQVAGKPRPDLLARCNPNVANAGNFTVSTIAQGVLEEATPLVSFLICRNSGAELDDGFRSFPSGHASFSTAGLVYLALWTCAKFAISTPFLNVTGRPAKRTHRAAAPVYLVFLPVAFVGLAVYVCLTRYSDYRHHGFDIISGALVGLAGAWLGFYWYQMPFHGGDGSAWAPRNTALAFGHGIGRYGYGEDDVEQLHTAEAAGAFSGRNDTGLQQYGQAQGQEQRRPTDGDIELQHQTAYDPHRQQEQDRLYC